MLDTLANIASKALRIGGFTTLRGFAPPVSSYEGFTLRLAPLAGINSLTGYTRRRLRRLVLRALHIHIQRFALKARFARKILE